MASIGGHAYLLAPSPIMTNHEAIRTAAAIAGRGSGKGWFLIIDAPLLASAASAPGAPSADASAADVEPRAGTDAASWLERRLLGLSVVLRLALTAQAAGARAIVLAPGPQRAVCKRALDDRRLKIDVVEAGPDENIDGAGAPAATIRLPANLVVHRTALATLAAADADAIAFDPDRLGDDPDWRAAREAAGPYGFDPILVDRSTFAAAEQALLRSLRKPQDGWTSTYLNRPISLSITRRLVATELRPNQVSVAILGVGLLGAYLASRGTYLSLVAGAALFQAQSVLDGCDGEMSRLTFRGSHTGEWLDTIGDDLTNYGFFAGAAWGLFTGTGSIVYLALGALTVFCGLVGSGLEYRYLVKIGSGDLLKYPLGIGKAPGGDESRAEKSATARILDAIAPLFKRDTFVLLTLLGAILGATGPLLAVFAVGAVGVLFAVIKAELRMARERGEKRAAAGDPSTAR